jgi:predicted nucleic-acid-binding protein
MRAVDTNVLVRLLTRDDAGQVSAAESFVAAGAWVSQLVLAEAVWVLATVYELSPAQLSSAIEMVLNHRDLSVEQREVVAAALEQFRRRPALGFTDCLVIEIARKAGHLPLGMFDRGFGRVDGAERLGAEARRT